MSDFVSYCRFVIRWVLRSWALGPFLCIFVFGNEDLPDFASFHSNLGIQEIVEMGVPLMQEADLPDRIQKSVEKKPEKLKESTTASAKEIISAPVIPEKPEEIPAPEVQPSNKTEVKPSEFSQTSQQENPGIWERGETESATTSESKSRENKEGIQISAQSGLRTYRTSNVLRSSDNLAESSGVFEANVAASVQTMMDWGEYMTMIPRIDLMLQWAQYQERSDLLNYRFGLIKGGFGLALPRDWMIGFYLDYNILHNMQSGDKTYDAWTPSLTLQKSYSVFDDSFLMIDVALRSANTSQSTVFPAAGIFADSGDNYQNTLSLTYGHFLDEEGNLMLLPRIGFSRTNYHRSPNTGRLDYLFSGGTSLMYNWRDFLGIQTFFNYSSMSSDTIPDFDAFDVGLGISGNYRF